MKKQTKQNLKKAGAMVGAIAVVGLSAFAGSQIFPKTITETHTVTETVEVPVEVIKEVPVEVEKIVTKNVTVEVPVEDTELNKMLCDRLMYEDLDECVTEVKAEDEAMKMALDKLLDEAFVFDLLEDEGIISDEYEASIIKIYDDFEDIEVTESDYDDNEYEFVIEAKVEDEDADVKKKVEFTISVRDGDVEIESVSEI